MRIWAQHVEIAGAGRNDAVGWSQQCALVTLHSWWLSHESRQRSLRLVIHRSLCFSASTLPAPVQRSTTPASGPKGGRCGNSGQEIGGARIGVRGWAVNAEPTTVHRFPLTLRILSQSTLKPSCWHEHPISDYDSETICGTISDNSAIRTNPAPCFRECLYWQRYCCARRT